MRGSKRGRPVEPASAAPRQDDRAGPARPSAIDIVLATLWLIVPCVQYVGSYLRAGVQMDIATGRRGDLNVQGLESLALWDLTPLYALLLTATVMRVVLRRLAERRTTRR